MKPELTEAEHYQTEEAPSRAILWVVGACLLAVFAGAAAIGISLT